MRVARTGGAAACLALALLALLALLAAASSARGTSVARRGDVSLVDQTWKCSGAVDVGSVTVTIDAGVAKNGVLLGAGCTGHIGFIRVKQSNSDGIKVGAGAHDLVIDGGSIVCAGRAPGVHQDGVQVMGGRNIVFRNLDVRCATANDSQAMIHQGAGQQELPTDVVFDGGRFGDATQTGAYGVSIGDSVRSGFRNATICPAHLHTFFVGSGALDPVDVGNRVAASCAG
jgi:hypothetical protein